jgi:hypothetical protein
MGMVNTTNGEMDEALLEKREGETDNAKETAHWTEYWSAGELVHRSVHVTLKPQAAAHSAIERF